MRRRYSQVFIRTMPVLLGMSGIPAVSAADWKAEAGVAPGVVYTDNVCLEADGGQGALIGTVTPDISLQGDGNRANLNLGAAVELNTLSDSKLEDFGCTPRGFSNRGQYAPRLNAVGDVVLLDDWFFLDATANIGQNTVNPFQAGGNDPLDRTGNTNTTYRYTLSPYVSHRFKQTALLNLRYTWDDQTNSKEVVGDSTQETVAFSLGSVPGTSSAFWGLQADYDHLRSNRSLGRPPRDSELSSAQINGGYQFTRRWQVNGYVGKEKNDFFSITEEIDGDFWDVGLRWTPSIRTTVDVGYGDRFFGEAPRFAITHRHKRSVFRTDYSRRLTYSRNTRTLDDPGGPSVPSDPNTTISSSPILDERFNISYGYEGRRTNLRIAASHSDQTRAEDGRDATFQRASVSLTRTLNNRFSVNGRLGWDETNPKGERSDFVQYAETWRFTLGATRNLNERLEMTLDYTYTDRDSDRLGARSVYQENRITLAVRYDI